MKLSDLRTHVLDLLQDPEQDIFDNPILDRWINREAGQLFQIIKEHAPEELLSVGTFNTVIDTREYNLVTVNTNAMSNLLDVYKVERSSTTDTSRPRPMIVDRTFNRGRRDITDERVYLRSTYLGFYKAPKEVFTVHVTYMPDVTVLVEEDDDLGSTGFADPRLRDEFQDALVYRAAYRLLMSENGNYIPYKQEAEQAQMRMVKSLRRRVRGAKWINYIPKQRKRHTISGVTGR